MGRWFRLRLTLRFGLPVTSKIPVSEFKKILEEKTGIKVDRQRLIYKAKPLMDEHKLSDSIKDDEQTIHLIARPEQSPPQAEPQQERAPQEGQGIFGQLSNLISGMFGQTAPLGGQIILEGPEVTYQRFEVPLQPRPQSAPQAQGAVPQVSVAASVGHAAARKRHGHRRSRQPANGPLCEFSRAGDAAPQ